MLKQALGPESSPLDLSWVPRRVRPRVRVRVPTSDLSVWVRVDLGSIVDAGGHNCVCEAERGYVN